MNLGERKAGTASAYSVFNKSGRGIEGAATSFDNELRGGLVEHAGGSFASHGASIAPCYSMQQQPDMRNTNHRSRLHY